MSILVGIEVIENRPGSSATILCAFDHGIPGESPIKKTITVPDFLKQEQVREYVLNDIADHSKEVDRHIEFWLAKKEKRPDTNPPHLWQQPVDVSLFERVTPEDIERVVSEAMK